MPVTKPKNQNEDPIFINGFFSLFISFIVQNMTKLSKNQYKAKKNLDKRFNMWSVKSGFCFYKNSKNL